ncbi:MAG: phosphate propanoyltransferase [Hespellia sp.]|nr:phosphate propanoyltransferase [Hespellia sp.]
MSKEDLVRLVTAVVVEAKKSDNCIPLGVSNHHIHLDRADMDILFGKGSELTHKKDLGQPGQYASEELVTIKGPKGALERIRVLGPLRSETQLEISRTDSFILGIKAPVRDSGNVTGTPGCEIIGPCGSVTKAQGVMIAKRHIHMTPEESLVFGVKDLDLVDVRVGDEERGAVFSNVLVRVSDRYALEMHIDTDEANATGAKNGDLIRISK